MVKQLLKSQNGPNRVFNGQQNGSSPQTVLPRQRKQGGESGRCDFAVFLGVKIECAQCHAHPFAKWTKEQFWEFAAFYSATPQIFALRRGCSRFSPNFQPGREILIPVPTRSSRRNSLTARSPIRHPQQRSTNSGRLGYLEGQPVFRQGDGRPHLVVPYGRQLA